MNFKNYLAKNSLFITWMILLTIVFFSPLSSWATPEYSDKTEQGCKTCHLEKEGGKLSTEGLEYAASDYFWPPKGGYRLLGSIRKSVKLIIGYIHILSAFIWFGTILLPSSNNHLLLYINRLYYINSK